MSAEAAWEVDDLIQISPTHDDAFGGSVLVVTEVKAWGVIGYVVVPKKCEDGSALAFYRLPRKPEKDGCTVTGVRVGRAHWLFDEGSR